MPKNLEISEKMRNFAAQF